MEEAMPNEYMQMTYDRSETTFNAYRVEKANTSPEFVEQSSIL
jgi:hypothetical protein